jgi:hypothetical protein
MICFETIVIDVFVDATAKTISQHAPDRGRRILLRLVDDQRAGISLYAWPRLTGEGNGKHGFMDVEGPSRGHKFEE